MPFVFHSNHGEVGVRGKIRGQISGITALIKCDTTCLSCGSDAVRPLAEECTSHQGLRRGPDGVETTCCRDSTEQGLRNGGKVQGRTEMMVGGRRATAFDRGPWLEV